MHLLRFFFSLLNRIWGIIVRDNKREILSSECKLLLWNTCPFYFLLTHIWQSSLERSSRRVCLTKQWIWINRQVGASFQWDFSGHESEWPVSQLLILLLLQMCLINFHWEWCSPVDTLVPNKLQLRMMFLSRYSSEVPHCWNSKSFSCKAPLSSACIWVSP